ncbi:zinc finger protein 135-like [Schistocerca piceifrons]|uniref:zinc finger protein 135-like n=1 Tax=Schistocerca piceifrons TaxID=274613 RepID=UPI001F5F540F|nr:zinc finger protein 135-like [Schistocerca piceifrons]XP_047118244.1 zinc finger protein 135-like [Schistocerca piceifrons]XP_047118251.1 zinc finger protein 135-like [Schistocerca piceifrons]XP_049951996.1 zinc finger protein 135-like [Schistocerca serialis cubense]XP_049951997.1 zinc finger protein 135-like [Schistocerca serialis cubense]
MSQVSHEGCSAVENDISSTYLRADSSTKSVSVVTESIINNVKEKLPDQGDNSLSSGVPLKASSGEKEKMRDNKISCGVSTNVTFTCSTCFKQFLSKSALIRHVFIHLPDAPKPGDICELCGEVFQSAEFLQRHVVSFHVGKSVRNGALIGQDSEIPVTNSPCEDSFEPPRKKQRCVDTTGNILICTLCDKSFLRLDLLRKHYMVHTGEKPYRCEVCGKTFVQRGLLGRHQFVHSAVQPFACNSCPERFSNTQALRQHTLVHTSGSGLVYNCEMCGVPFTEHAGLRRHWMSHSGEDPYQCDICSKSFAHPGHLRMHRLGHLEEIQFL